MSNPKCVKTGKVWGFSSNAPNMLTVIDSLSTTSDPRLNEYWPSGHIAYAGLSPADPAFPAVPVFQDGASYSVVAAKVPSSYPYGCSTEPITSSVDPRSIETWSSSLVIIADVVNRGTELSPAIHVTNCHAVCWSRAVYLDGVQTRITYGVTSLLAGEPSTTYDDEGSIDHPTGHERHCDHALIDINASTTVVKSIEYLGNDVTTIGDVDAMTSLYFGVFLPSSGAQFQFFDEGVQCRPNCRYCGDAYYFFSQYTPDLDICDGSTTFVVGRVRYSDYQLFCGGSGGLANPSTGSYLIVLPSCRGFILTHPPIPPHGSFSLEADRLPDEPWVTAIKLESNPDYPDGEGSKPYITTGLVTGRALNEVMRGDYWDGTLQTAEIANVIVPPASGPYTGEVWKDMRVRSYNHIYGDDLLLWTTKPTPTSQTASPLADFGVDGGTADLNHNLSDVGLAFKNLQDEHGNGWRAQANGYFLDPGTWSTIDPGKFSCMANLGPTFIGQIDLILEGYVVNNDSSISYKPRLDNRAQSVDFPFTRQSPPVPMTDGHGNHDSLEFSIDGVVKFSTFNGDFTTDAEYDTFRDAQVHDGIAAGKRIFRWTLKRVTTANDLAAWIDDIQFPEMLITDDINGVKRWFNAGGRVRQAKYWAFPKRDDEQSIELGSRVSTVPDFITKDSQGRILYGNCHYVCRVIVEGIDNALHPDGILDLTHGDKGFIRFTASPVTPPPPQYQNENCEWVDGVQSPFDQIADPKGFQILPFGTKGDYQLRGVNGALRDATDDPLNLELYPNEEFAYLLNVPAFSTAWNYRASSWTVTDDGTSILPHLEVLFKPTFDQPAYPVAPDAVTYPATDGYQTPPFAGRMQADSSVLESNQLAALGDPFYQTLASPSFCRIREPHAFGTKASGDPDTRKPVWTGLSIVGPRIYGDTYSLRPQFVWAKPDHILHPDPMSGDDPGYGVYPYPSAQWLLVVTRHCPSADRFGYLQPGPALRHCPNDPDNPDPDPNNWHYTWSIPSGSIGAGFTDFDVVDEECDCDCGG